MVSHDSLVELKSTRAQLEVGLIYLKRRHAELQKQIAAHEQRRGGTSASLLLEVQRQAREMAAEIERRQLAIEEIVEQIKAAETKPKDDGVARLLLQNEKLGEDLAAVRAEILQSLRALAGPLQRYQELVDQKTLMVRQIASATGRDQAYSNYIECALLRQAEYEGDLRAAIEIVKRLRVVA